MTIAVARFVSALPANPAAASTTLPVDGASTGNSIITGDFASLLFGQMMPGLPAAEAAIVAEAENKVEALTTDAVAVADPAQLFASLGLPVPPTGPASSAAGGSSDSAAKVEFPPLASLPSGSPTTDSSASLAATEAGIRAAATVPAASAASAASSASSASSASAEDAPLASNKTAGALGEETRSTGIATQNTTFVLPETKLPAKVAVTEAGVVELPRLTETPAAGNTAPAATHIAAAQLPSAPVPADHSSLRLATPVRDASWPADFSQKVVWMARQDLQSAQITLNPPQLGPIEVSLDIRNEQATATFVSANPEVREAIESSLPRLREMLAGVGVELGQANVSHESFRQAREQNNNGNGRQTSDAGTRQSAAGGTLQPGIMAAGTNHLRTGRGLVDTFA